MDPRRYSQQPSPQQQQVINLVEEQQEEVVPKNVIDLVDFEEKINWLPKRKIEKVISDETSTFASETTMEHVMGESKDVEHPVYDAIMCTAGALLAQSRDEMLLLTDVTEHLNFVENREEPQVDFDCTIDSSRELWFGCLMDAAGDAAEFLTEGFVGASNSGHKKATDRLLQLKEEREKRKSLDKTNEAPAGIPEIVDVCDLQDQETLLTEEQQQHDVLMMLPKKKKDPPASRKESKEASIPLLEIRFSDAPENNDIHNL